MFQPFKIRVKKNGQIIWEGIINKFTDLPIEYLQDEEYQIYIVEGTEEYPSIVEYLRRQMKDITEFDIFEAFINYLKKTGTIPYHLDRLKNEIQKIEEILGKLTNLESAVIIYYLMTSMAADIILYSIKEEQHDIIKAIRKMKKGE